jgi:hydrogenase maturation protease
LIGVGNPDRGDDVAGRSVAQTLAGELPGDIEVLQLSGEATELVSQLQGAQAVILVDASSSGAPAGTVQRFDVVAEPLPRELFAVSTHGVGVADAIELARASLHRLCDRGEVLRCWRATQRAGHGGAPRSCGTCAGRVRTIG